MSASGENLDLNLSLAPRLSKMCLEMQSLSPAPLVGTPFSASSFELTTDKLVTDCIDLIDQNCRSILPTPPLVPRTDEVLCLS